MDDIIAIAMRGGLLDMEYRGSIAVTDTEGRILFSLGDPRRVAFARSSAKPMQAIAAIESGAAEHYGLNQNEIAMIAASHSGQPHHLAIIRAMLEKAGLDESFLGCGPSYPLYLPEADRMKKQDIPPAPIYHNCSGKHTGMLLTAKFLGEDLSDYMLPDHPVQRRITALIGELCDYDPEKIILGCDGCGVPVHALPLFKFAQGFARMASPESIGGKRGEIAAQVTAAMTARPDIIAGTGRICTQLMGTFGDRLFAKAGADGYYAVGLIGKGIGITLKMSDGYAPVVPYAIFETLIQLGVITRDEAQAVELYSDHNIYNTRREIVGHTEAAFNLEKERTI